MSTRQFAYKLNRASKNIRVEMVLYKRYVEEMCIYDLAELLGVSYDTLNNYLCTARLEMLTAIERDFDILPKETQNLIKKLLE